MKWLIAILFPCLLSGQEVGLKIEDKIEIIPTIATSYSMDKVNIEGVERSSVIPEVSLGIAMKDKRWFMGVKYGFVWNTVELEIGVVLFKINK